MSVIVVKSETNEYRILVKAGGDEDLARQEAVKAAISAEEARLSAISSGDSEQVATEKAAQTLEDAASALASKQDAESAATASEAAKNLILNDVEANITTAGTITKTNGLFASANLTRPKGIDAITVNRNANNLITSIVSIYNGVTKTTVFTRENGAIITFNTIES
jgi:membrane protein involved in colicin uptake